MNKPLFRDTNLLVLVKKLKEDIREYKAEHNKQLTQKDKEIENLKEQNERWSEECKKLIAKELQFDYMVIDIENLLFTLENKHLMTEKDECKNLKRRLKEYHAIHHGATYPDEGITEASARFAWNLD